MTLRQLQSRDVACRRGSVAVVPPRVDSPASLTRLHRAMLGAIREPLTKNYTMRQRARDGRRMQDVAAAFVKPNDRLTSRQRLEIYNKQYWFRLLDCLADDFPGLRAVLGDPKFFAMARAYLDACPSRRFTLRDLGERLPAFLQREPRWAGPRQELAVEMARFEWAQVVAFDAAESPPLTIDELLGQDAATFKVALQPCITLLELHYPADDFVVALKKETRSAGIEGGTRRAVAGKRHAHRLLQRQHLFLAVHRLDFDLYYKRLDPPAFAVLLALLKGSTLAQACLKGARLATTTPEEFQQHLRIWFGTWAQLGWFCRRPNADEGNSHAR